jgi:hypothetical protein
MVSATPMLECTVLDPDESFSLFPGVTSGVSEAISLTIEAMADESSNKAVASDTSSRLSPGLLVTGCNRASKAAERAFFLGGKCQHSHFNL